MTACNSNKMGKHDMYCCCFSSSLICDRSTDIFRNKAHKQQGRGMKERERDEKVKLPTFLLGGLLCSKEMNLLFVAQRCSKWNPPHSSAFQLLNFCSSLRFYRRSPAKQKKRTSNFTLVLQFYACLLMLQQRPVLI